MSTSEKLVMANLQILVLGVLLSACSASCPNDCSQRGRCNIYSACECYRNWMGADCSQRVCYFSHAFIDTPQGDLNADGRVDRPDTFIVEAYMDESWDGSAAQMAKGDFPANMYLGQCGGDASDLKNWATVIQSSSPMENDDGYFSYELVVTTTTGAPPLTGNDAEPCTEDECFAKYDEICVQAVSQATTTGSDFEQFELGALYLGSRIFAQRSVFDTQFTNRETWELFPKNHGAANQNADDPVLKAFFDEAHFYSECSGKGICDRDSGECECFDGYEGEGCTRSACPNACSGHGVCTRLGDMHERPSTEWDRHKTQHCVCDAGYTNPDCSQRICPSGDDPISRNQKSEAQYFGYMEEIVPDSSFFALEFTDEFGDKWVTRTLDMARASAKEVEEALEELPNNVVQDVQVENRYFPEDTLVDSGGIAVYDNGEVDCGDDFKFESPCPTDDHACCGFPRVWAVTFLSNSGDIPLLGARFTLTDSDNDNTYKDEDSDGQFFELNVCGDDATVGGCVLDSGANASYPLWDLIGKEEVQRLEDELDTDTIQIRVLDATTAAPFFIAEGTKGTSENHICSDRGICDYDIGVCKCFNGFTDDDCSRQNALAMY